MIMTTGMAAPEMMVAQSAKIYSAPPGRAVADTGRQVIGCHCVLPFIEPQGALHGEH